MNIRTRSGKRRRGVLLLVVLGILAMFGLIAVTFVVISSQFRRASLTNLNAGEYDDSAPQDLDEAMRTASRGSTNPNCPIWPHGFLEDLYGANSVQGQVTGVSLVGQGKLVAIVSGIAEPERRVGSVLTMLNGNGAGESFRIVGFNPATGLQILIETVYPVLGRDGVPATGGYGAPGSDDLIRVGDVFLVNGAPFSGTGIGFDPALPQAAALSLADSNGVPYALRPNAAAPSFSAGPPQLDYVGYLNGNPFAAVASNEDYDAVDLQNMYLALILQDNSVPIPSFHRPELARYWIRALGDTAAFNNPALFASRFNSLPQALQRKIVLRPMPMDHFSDANNNGQWDPGETYFTGSNLRWTAGSNPLERGFNPLWYPGESAAADLLFSYDVDNNGDTIPDGIWLDLAFPAQTDPKTGKMYKPLFSYLILDLDGRFNLNAQGCLAQAAGTGSTISVPNPALRFAGASGTSYLPVLTADLPRGQGMGPADVDLRGLFPTDPAYLAFLQDRYFDPPAGTSPGFSGSDDPVSQNKTYDYWNNAARALLGATANYNYWDFLTAPAAYPANAYGAPTDRKVLGAAGLDPRGQVIYAFMGGNSEEYDDPYELSLAKQSQSAADRPYSPAEFERVERQSDVDANKLPNRLATVAGGVLAAQRHRITTESWDLPCPGITLNNSLLTRLRGNATHRNELLALGWYPPKHLRDVFAVKMYLDLRSATPAVPAAQAETLVRNNLARLVSFDMLAGRKMDLNRSFGNGQDDNLNGVPDEPAFVIRNAGGQASLSPVYPGELIYTRGSQTLREQVPQVDALGNLVANVPFDAINGVDVNNDGTVDDVDRALARQLFARYLYILGLWAVDHQVANATSPTAAERDRARMVAQWAVNVVDFRDRDSIMTPFEYDISPFTDENGDGNTWDVDGLVDQSPPPAYSDDTTAWRGLVWGCERPEVLISEAVALHDRRTQDLPDDGGTVAAPGGDNNSDFDQKFRPEGSFFFELYNTATRLEPKTRDLYTAADGGIELGKLAPNNSPVWRVTVYDNATTDPDNPSNAPERSIYFADIAAAASFPVTGDGQRHFPSVTANVPLMPGRYAVIGAGARSAIQAGQPAKTYLGFRTGQDLGDDQTRRIVLDPTKNLAANPAAPGTTYSSEFPVAVLYNTNADQNDLPVRRPGNTGQPQTAPPRLQPPMAVVVDRTKTGAGAAANLRLSLTEPLGGYPSVDSGGTAFDEATGQYATAFPQPLDKTGNAALWPTLALDGITPRFRVVHLQRLANPMLPWDAQRNPYRTVDTTVVDLTTFDGVNRQTAATDPGEGPAPMASLCYSRERGENNKSSSNPTTNTDNNPWTQENLTGLSSDPAANGTLSAIGGHYFTAPLHHTLGYLNYPLNTGASGLPRDASNGVDYMGDPQGQPFPWLAWNNRPFTSELELMLVPALGPRELLANPDELTNPNQYPYERAFGISATSPNPYANRRESFPHLINFFYQGGDAGSVQPGMFHRLLELVYVPSRFVGVEIQGDPQDFAAQVGAPYAPPFHLIPAYREPGRINFNTVADALVLDGLMNNYPGLDLAAFRQKIVRTRQGYAGADLSIDPDWPTRFVRPLRTSGGWSLVPPTSADTALLGSEPEIHRTLLRQDPLQAGRPLLSFDNAPGSVFPGGTTEVNNPDRNAYFRQHALQRLGNLVTGRSNVYGMWVTVGYFEVSPAPTSRVGMTPADVAAVYPDGYCLGEEMGYSTGSQRRHRAFYLIDRSIPVGFERGKDHNLDKAILINRFIE